MGFLDDLKKKAEARASQVYDQVNMLDNGRTYQQRTPTNNRSNIGQLTHNGVTNTVGNFVAKPFLINPAQNVIETGRMAAADVTGNVAAQNASRAREWQNLKASLPGAIVSNAYHIGKANTYDLAKQSIADMTGNEVASRNANDAYMKDINQSAIGGLLNIPQRKLAAYQVHRDLPQLNKEQQDAAIKQNLQNVNLDPNANLADQVKTTGFSALQLSAPTFGLAKAGVEGTPFISTTQPSYMSGATFYDMAKNGYKSGAAGLEAYRKNTTPLNEAGSVQVPGGAPEAPKVPDISKGDAQAIVAGMKQQAKVAPLTPDQIALQNHAQTTLDLFKKPAAATVRPAADLQTALETAWNKNDMAGAQKVIDQMPPELKAPMQALQDTKAGTPASVKPVVDPKTGKIVLQPKDPAAAAAAPNQKLSRFANRTVPNSEEVSPALQKMVKDEKVAYDPHTNEGRLAAADAWLKGKSNDAAYGEIIKQFENPKSVTDQHVVNAIQAAKKLDATANEANLMKATEIYDNLSRHLTEKGQEIQAASLLNNRTPEGLQYAAQKALRNGKVEITPEIAKGIKSFVDNVKKTEPGSEARDLAVKQLQQYVARQIPAPMLDKLISTWKAGLLTGVKTVTGNAESNATFRIGHEASKPLAVALDKGISMFTGKRSQALTYRGALSGAGEGFAKGWEYFKTGIDERNGVGNKFLENGGREINFKNKVVGAYVNGVFRNMAAQDRPFYYSQLRTSLNELATVAGKNEGLKGSALRDYVTNSLKDPAMDMMQQAKNEADKAVLAHETGLQQVIGGARQAVNRMDPSITKTVLKTAIETTMPFTGVPSAFVSRVIDFTPVGALKEVGNQIRSGKFDQRALTTAISEATTGTAMMWVGSQLAKQNMLSGPYPNDPKEQARWKAEGITPNSIKIDGKWISLNYLGPAGMLFNAGGRAHEASANGGNAISQVSAAAGGAPKDLTQQSFLQGLSNAVGAVNDPGRYFNNYLNSQAGSVIPTLVNDVGNATDNYQRDRNNPLQAVESRIPGVRQSLPISNDVFGNKLQATSNPVDRMINPLRPSNERQSPIFDEVNRLHNAKVDVTPTPLDKTQSFDGIKVPLSDAQRKELQTNVGQNVQKLWGDAIKSDEYKALSDDGKKKMLDDIYSTVLEGEKRKYSADKQLGQFNDQFQGQGKKPTKNAANYIDGNIDLAHFAKEPGTGNGGGSQVEINKSVSNDTKTMLKAYNNMDSDQRQKYFDQSNENEYKYQLAKYENDKANGTLTRSEDARAKYDIAQAKVGSSYTKETRDMYSLNKTELYSLLKSDPAGQALANQIVAYGDALESAGLGNNKWRDSKGNISIAPKSRTAGGSGKAKDIPDSVITATASSAKAAAGAKVASKSGINSKVAKRGLQAYAKTGTAAQGPSTVTVTKKNLSLARSSA